jgi:hypothetical protein
VPQDLVQAFQEFQVPRQSTGQGWLLQVALEVRESQARPPSTASRVIERVRDLTPPPHFWVQIESTDQEEVVQSMGHLNSLHVLYFEFSVEHSVPPLRAAVTIDRRVIFVPPLQVLVHADQAAHAE